MKQSGKRERKKSEKSFYSGVLLRLRRAYSKDEAVAVFIHELDELKISFSRLQVRSGMQKSEISELEYQISILQREKTVLASKCESLQRELVVHKIVLEGNSTPPLSKEDQWKKIFNQVDRKKS